MSKELEKLNYADAISEVEQILERFDGEKIDVDKLAAQVKRATELINLCKKKLRKAEAEVAKILKDGDE